MEREMYLKAGFRERFAMENGKPRTKNNMIIFEYSENIEYQDANGATWDKNRKEWVN